MTIDIGTAGWSLRREHWPLFPEQGTHLQRYAGRLRAVEVNSCFYRSHRPSTWERWADSVPDDFRFSVKLPQAITHEKRLVDCQSLVAAFLHEAGHLGIKLGPVLIQLPPSLAFDSPVVQTFFRDLREQHDGPVACEPRHRSWFVPEADELLKACDIARVAADPPRGESTMSGCGTTRLAYLRLHGSPRVYYSNYDRPALEQIEQRIRTLQATAAEIWCIFDNTAAGAATLNALDLQRRLADPTAERA